MKNGRSLARSEHRRHDRLLVTRFAMDDAYPGELAEARSLIETCTDCALLADDIRLISASVAQLPKPVRTRDYTISAEQAEQLKGSRLSRWLRSISGPGWAALRPVSAAALSIGMVMAVVGASLPQAPNAVTTFGSGAAEADGLAPVPSMAARPGNDSQIDSGPLGPAAGDPPPGEPSGPAFEALATQDPVTERYDVAYLESPAPDETTDDAGIPMHLAAPSDPTRDLLVYAGLVIAIVSLGLLALALVARRYFADPLLR